MPASNIVGDGAAPVRPLPWPDAISEGFWNAARHHELHIQRCRGCRRWNHLPVIICPACGSLDLGYEQVSGRATLRSWTIVHEAPAPGFKAMLPLILGVVELVEQPQLLMASNVVDVRSDMLALGMALEAAFDDVTDACTLVQFRPVSAQ